MTLLQRSYACELDADMVASLSAALPLRGQLLDHG